MLGLDKIREQTLYRPCDIDVGRPVIPDGSSDYLAELINKLGEIRLNAVELHDKFFIYLIDVAIFHAHAMLDHQSDLGEHEKWS